MQHAFCIFAVLGIGFRDMLSVVNYYVLISQQPLIPVQNMSWFSIGLETGRLTKG